MAGKTRAQINDSAKSSSGIERRRSLFAPRPFTTSAERPDLPAQAASRQDLLDSYLQRRRVAAPVIRFQPAASGGGVLQRKVRLEDFLDRVVIYTGELERYSHQGYPEFGKRTRKDVENYRAKVIETYSSLDEGELARWNRGEFRWRDVPKLAEFAELGIHFDTDLIYFHATNLHLEPLASVGKQENIPQYHQTHLAPRLGGGSERNFATLYYEIAVQFNKVGRPFTLTYSGSYAGRSGNYETSHTIKAPASPGFGAHQVVSTDYKEQQFETFTDHHVRELDSEVAIFEDLNSMISKDLKSRGIPHYTTSGQVNLFTDRATCNSCTALAMQFQNRWKVPVNVRHGGVDDFKGYV